MSNQALCIAKPLNWTPDASFIERDVELGPEFRLNVFAPNGGLVELTGDALSVLMAYGKGKTLDEVCDALGAGPEHKPALGNLTQMLEQRGFLRPVDVPRTTPAKIPPAFLAAAHGCGGTLLRYILDAHPDLACASPHRLMLPFRDMMEMAAQTDAFAGLKIKHADALKILGKSLGELLSLHARIRQKAGWVWASRDHDVALHFLNNLFEREARFICIIRHPLDAAETSARKYAHEGWHSRRMIDLLHKHDSPEAAYAHYWTEVYQHIRAFRDSHPDSLHIVHYEQLVTQPNREIGRALEFLGLSMPADLLQRAFSTPHEMLEGGWESFGFQKAKGIETEHINLWRKWDPGLVTRVNRIVEHEMEAWGYSLSSSHSRASR